MNKVNAKLKREIIRLRESGLSFSKIGAELGLAEGTVKTHYYLATGQPSAPQRIPESPYIRYDSPPTLEGDALILPDVEIPFHHAEFLDRVIDLAEAWGIRQVICAGDLLHMDSISGWEPNWASNARGSVLSEADEKRLMDLMQKLPKRQQAELADIIGNSTGLDGKDYSAEMTFARKTLNALDGCFDKFVWVLGNHECLDAETEVFADGEWKNYKDVIPGKSKVLVFNDGQITSEIVEALHEYDYSGEMYHTKTMLVDMKVTPNHRIVWHPAQGEWRYEEAKKIYDRKTNTRAYLPLAGNLYNSGAMLSDDEIRIAGWIYTDCTIDKRTGYYQFSQRKSKHHLITEILDRLGIDYGIYERERNTTCICGKRLLKKPEHEISITVNAEGSRRLEQIVNDKESIADWAWNLDNRQFDIFLHAYIDGDGSIHKSSKNSMMIYCNREKLAGQLQTLCIMHGHRATISRYNGNNIRINITPRLTLSLDGGYNKNTTIEIYEGKVWCITVPSGNFLIRRNGRPVFTGNSRLLRAINSPVSPTELLNMMRLQEGKWIIAPYYYCLLISAGETFRITHPKSAADNAARALATQYHQHILMGHSHKMMFDYDPSGKFMAIQMGHAVDENRLAYAAQRDARRNSHKLGAVIVRDGHAWLLNEHSDWERMKRVA
jgi:hypothetical protein